MPRIVYELNSWLGYRVKHMAMLHPASCHQLPTCQLSSGLLLPPPGGLWLLGGSLWGCKLSLAPALNGPFFPKLPSLRTLFIIIIGLLVYENWRLWIQETVEPWGFGLCYERHNFRYPLCSCQSMAIYYSTYNQTFFGFCAPSSQMRSRIEAIHSSPKLLEQLNSNCQNNYNQLVFFPIHFREQL